MDEAILTDVFPVATQPAHAQMQHDVAFSSQKYVDTPILLLGLLTVWSKVFTFSYIVY